MTAHMMSLRVLPKTAANLILNGTLRHCHRGYSDQYPPTQLTEVCNGIIALIRTPICVGLVKIIPGPDFPTGGIIYDKITIMQAPLHRPGGIVMRAKTEIVEEKPVPSKSSSANCLIR
ncbi:MAG: DNA gyrase subunit A [Patescibacteria group bacterium]